MTAGTSKGTENFIKWTQGGVHLIGVILIVIYFIASSGGNTLMKSRKIITKGILSTRKVLRSAAGHN